MNDVFDEMLHVHDEEMSFQEPVIDTTEPLALVSTRNSSRHTKPTTQMKDYMAPVVGQNSKYPLANHLSYDRVSSKYHSYLAKFSDMVEPQTFGQASKHPRWIEAMKLEIKALEDNKTWLVVDLPLGKHAVYSKWIYKIKHKADGDIKRFKSRIVAKGYSQQERLDYHDTFSPVVKMVTVRSVIVVDVSKGWFLYQMDMYNAFLQGDLDEEVYMEMPEVSDLGGQPKFVNCLNPWTQASI